MQSKCSQNAVKIKPILGVFSVLLARFLRLFFKFLALFELDVILCTIMNILLFIWQFFWDFALKSIFSGWQKLKTLNSNWSKSRSWKWSRFHLMKKKLKLSKWVNQKVGWEKGQTKKKSETLAMTSKAREKFDVISCKLNHPSTEHLLKMMFYLEILLIDVCCCT